MRFMRLYEIPKREFDTPFPERAVRGFKPFDNVDRANFMSFVIRSFIESRGSPLMHATFIRVEEHHTLINIERTLRNLIGWRAKDTWLKFNPVERKMYSDAYKAQIERQVAGNSMATHLVPRNMKTIHRALSPDVLVLKFGTWTEDMVKDLQEDNLAFPVSHPMSFEEFDRKRRVWFETEYLESLHRHDDEKND